MCICINTGFKFLHICYTIYPHQHDGKSNGKTAMKQISKVGLHLLLFPLGSDVILTARYHSKSVNWT
ncbi:unnamed protein product [Trifolium pratense]|uniref:Uncharacterized protein n=1 Tax=Trifolium pratense TaxID=57577 RepID=A0ACB0KYJ7_TRIPR|nr:unnamed protein product [Trifolium pratense]